MPIEMQSALVAISHPGRRRMLELVMEREVQAGDLAQLTGLTQPATSQHLKVLRDAGLVQVRIDGPRRLYRVNFVALDKLRSDLNAFWGSHLDALRRATSGEP